MATGLQKLQARGSKMRNDTAMTAKSQHPQNKDPEDVTPGPQYQQKGEREPLKIKLPKALESDAHTTGKKVMHLAEGHHVKNDDGSTSFHMHSLDGEPVGQDDAEPSDSMGEAAENGGGMQGSGGVQGSPYGISEALRGLSM